MGFKKPNSWVAPIHTPFGSERKRPAFAFAYASMELVLPIVLLVLGLVIGFAGARMLLRSKEEQALNAARLETQNEVSALRNEIGILTSKLQSSDVRLSEVIEELQL